jgi:hypothetical protein
MLHPPTDDVIEQTGVITYALEFLGPEGYVLEIGSHFSVGPPPDPVHRL